MHGHAANVYRFAYIVCCLFVREAQAVKRGRDPDETGRAITKRVTVNILERLGSDRKLMRRSRGRSVAPLTGETSSFVLSLISLRLLLKIDRQYKHTLRRHRASDCVYVCILVGTT